MKRRLAFAVLLTVACLVSSPALAQSDQLTIDGVNDDDYPTVEVTVTVPEALEDARIFKEAFAITENGEPRRRPILGNRPEEPESAPPRAVLAMDISGSMVQAIGRARAAADAFVQSLPTGSEVAVVTFGQDANVTQPFTDNLDAVRSSIQGVDVTNPDAQTALYDGVVRAADLLPSGDDAPASIILLSDGGDTVSTIEQDEAAAHLRERNATLWAVELQGSEPDPAALRALAGDTGDVLTAENADELTEIYVGLASDLSRRHVLRYESEASGETQIGVSVHVLEVSTSSSTTVEIDGTPAQAVNEAPPQAPPEVFTVATPMLGTTAAYALGLAAVVLGSLLIWLTVLAPRPPRTRERLLSEAGTNRPRLSTLAEWTTDVAERSLRDRSLGRSLDRSLEGAGLDLRPGEVAVIIVSMMLVAFAIGVAGGGLLLGLLLALMPPMITRLVLSVRRDRRQAAFTEQLTSVLQLISGSLRAGYGLVQGIDAVARDANEPAASEFRRILIEHRLGRDLSTAMQSCADRMDNADFSWVVQAISIHRDVGGDLSRVLDNIVATVRDRSDVHRQVRALSAEGRLSAIVLTGLPIVVLVGIRVISPDYMNVLFTRSVGWIMLAAAALLLLTGTLWIRRIMRVRY
jgi:tight adherence protein B